MAEPEEITLVHTREHIDRIAQSAGRRLTSFDADTEAGEQSYDVARLAVGGVFSLLDEIWQGRASRGFACVRPPGHHAEPNRPMGFCLFNNVALGAAYLLHAHGARRVMIVDIDAHHGNGTQAAFYDTDQVLYVSLHRFPAYPGSGSLPEAGCARGEGYTVNIPLRRDHGDLEIARLLCFTLNPLALAFQPELILVSCGFDLYHRDPLGGMRSSPEGYALMTFFLLDIAERLCGGRIAFVLEGGYSVTGIQACGLRVMQELCDVPTLSRDRIDRVIKAPPTELDVFRKLCEIHKTHWPGLA